MDKEKNRLLKLFHTLLSKTAGDVKANKQAILESFGVESSRDLDTHELLEACAALEREINPQMAKTDKYRKRLIAAIFGWLRAMNYTHNIKMVKAIACHAAGVKDFNLITDARLCSLYNAFTQKQKDLTFVGNMTKEELNRLTSMN